jgi:hypothetical protein
MMKSQTKINLCPHRHFTKLLVGVFMKQPFEHNWNSKTTSFSIRQFKSTIGMSSCNNHFAEDQINENRKTELEKSHEQRKPISTGDKKTLRKRSQVGRISGRCLDPNANEPWHLLKRAQRGENSYVVGKTKLSTARETRIGEDAPSPCRTTEQRKLATAEKPGVKKWSLANRRAATKSPLGIEAWTPALGSAQRTSTNWKSLASNWEDQPGKAETGKTRSIRTETEDQIVIDYSTREKKTTFSIEEQLEDNRSTEVTTLHSSFDWNKKNYKLFMAHFYSRKYEMMLESGKEPHPSRVLYIGPNKRLNDYYAPTV